MRHLERPASWGRSYSCSPAWDSPGLLLQRRSPAQQTESKKSLASHVDVWQKTQFCKAVIFRLKKLKKTTLASTEHPQCKGYPRARIFLQRVSGLICRPEHSNSFQSPWTPMRELCPRRRGRLLTQVFPRPAAPPPGAQEEPSQLLLRKTEN